MRVLGVIHARGGSRRIPLKNIKPLNGVPLIGYLVAAARAARFGRLILTTDDDRIMEAGRRYGAEVPFRRPADLAEDVPSERVTGHALDWAESDEGRSYDIVVTMQPTTPFLTTDDIDACIDAVAGTDTINCCFTAAPVSEPPQWMFEVGADGAARPFLDGVLEGERGVFQSLPPLHVPNGGAYATRVAAFRAQNRVIADPCRLRPMSHEHSVDIDEPIDWTIAEAVGRQLGIRPTEA